MVGFFGGLFGDLSDPEEGGADDGAEGSSADETDQDFGEDVLLVGGVSGRVEEGPEPGAENRHRKRENSEGDGEG